MPTPRLIANVLIKRGIEADLPELEIGELGTSTDTFKLFVGAEDGPHEIGGGNSGASNLADLQDVLLSSPGARQALIFNGTKWVNDGLVVSDIAGLQTALDDAAADLAAEASARAAAVSAEASSRASADSTLQSNIDAEASARAAADSTLQTNINAKQNSLGYTPENVANKDQANGYPGLDSSSRLTHNTTGTASNLSGTPALPDGTTATTQVANSNDSKVATNNYVDRAVSTLSNKSFSQSVGDGSTTTFTVTHNLGTTDVAIQVHDNSSGTVIDVESKVASSNSVQVIFAVAPTSNQYRVVVLASGGALTSVTTLPTGPSSQFVNTSTGNDTTGDGTSGAPWKTIAKAISQLPKLIEQDYTINVADGTYSEGISITDRASLGSKKIIFVGNSGTPNNVVLSGTVNYTGTRGKSNGTATVFLEGDLNISFTGFKLASAAADFDFYVRNGVEVTLKNFHGASASLIGCEITDGSYLQLIDSITFDAATKVGIEVLWGSRCAFYTSGGTPTMLFQGPSTVTDYVGVRVAYNSQMIIPGPDNCNVTFQVKNFFTAIQLGLQSCFNMFWFPSTFQAVNVTTPAGSMIVLATDQSSYETRNTTLWSHATFGFVGNSLAYGEHDSSGGTFTKTAIGTATSLSLGAQFGDF